jgi:heat shock protein HslJ
MRYSILSVLVWGFMSCTAIKPESDVIKLDGQHWRLSAINHKLINANDNAFLEFNDKLKVNGKAFCNSVSTDYELMGKNQLRFGTIVSTKMYCEGVMNLENEMITNMQNVRRYEIKNGMLYLYSSDAVLLTFKR